MPIATPEVYAQMLDAAKEKSFAYPAINVSSSQTLNAALKGFADAGSDGIIQVSTGGAVETDLAITGKPAQFGRGVMQDVSDKLLGQFVSCLEQRLAAPEPPQTTEVEEPAEAPAAAEAPA